MDPNPPDETGAASRPASRANTRRVRVHASVDAAGILPSSLLGFGELLREPSRSDEALC
jgi:hypothetical protein